MNQQMLERRDILIKAGMDKDEAKNIKDIKGTNMLIDKTKGVQYLNETMELIIEGIHEALAGGPLADEPVENLKMTLVDVNLHEDAIHRGPAQVIPAVRGAIKGGMLVACDSLFGAVEDPDHGPDGPDGGCNLPDTGAARPGVLTCRARVTRSLAKPVAAASFGFAGDIRSATGGRAMWNTEFAGFELVPNSMLKEVVVGIRKRKGVKGSAPDTIRLPCGINFSSRSFFF